MSYGKFATNVMTRKGQSSRWDYREIVKAYTKKARRQQGKKIIREERP